MTAWSRVPCGRLPSGVRRGTAQIFGILYAELLRRDVLVFPEGLDHVAAVGETGCLADVGHVVVGEEQHVLRLDHADILDVLLARTPVDLAELLRKEGVAHVATHGELLNLQRLVGVCVDVLRDGLDGAARRGGDLVGRREPALPPDAQYIDQDAVEVGVYDHVVPVMLGVCLPRASADKFQHRKSGKLLRREVEGDSGFLHRLQDSALELRDIPDILTETVQVELDHIVQQMLLHAGLVVDGVDALGRKGSHVAGVQQIFLFIALDQCSPLNHQNDLHIVVPV